MTYNRFGEHVRIRIPSLSPKDLAAITADTNRVREENAKRIDLIETAIKGFGGFDRDAYDRDLVTRALKALKQIERQL